ncbi:MAG: tetratricopeptide repeat protein [Thermodesulfobacteriota bacterium]
MNGIELIRNKWIILFCALMLFGILWGSFQWMYREQILLHKLYAGRQRPDQAAAMMLYREMMESGTNHGDRKSLARLAEILVRGGKGEEAIRVWGRLVSQMPEDRGLRFRLAVALHNQGKYLEAEKHFDVLLEGVNRHE